MIITESDRDSKSTIPGPQSAGPTVNIINAASSSRPPPPYQIAPASSPMSPSQPLVNRKTAHSEPAWRRFTKAFCAAVAIYMLVGILIKSFAILAERHFVDGVPSGPLEEDGHVLSCANQTWDLQGAQIPFPSIPPYTSKYSFWLPVSSSHIFLFSRGSSGHGTIKMELSDLEDDKIEFEIITRFYTLEARNRTNVCHLARDKDGQGIGIFTPRRLYPNYPRHNDQVSFDVTIRFPRSASSTQPMVINSLETNMGIWSHDIASLQNHIMFKSLSLSGSNTHIRSESLSAEFVQLKTSNAQITGCYNVSESLTLKTSNAPIRITLRMENKDGHKPTRAEMKTSNARIESPITLISTDNSSTPSPAAFSVTAKTSNGPVAVTFPGAPSSLFSHLNMNVMTSNAATSTRLHSTYEGSISLKTSFFTPSLVKSNPTTDPSGRDRFQHLDIRKVLRGALEAGVWWGDDSNEDEGKGKVIVTTSNAPNTLVLG